MLRIRMQPDDTASRSSRARWCRGCGRACPGCPRRGRAPARRGVSGAALHVAAHGASGPSSRRAGSSPAIRPCGRCGTCRSSHRPRRPRPRRSGSPSVGQHVVEQALLGIDHDGAGRLARRIVDQVAAEARILLGLGIERHPFGVAGGDLGIRNALEAAAGQGGERGQEGQAGNDASELVVLLRRRRGSLAKRISRGRPSRTRKGTNRPVQWHGLKRNGVASQQHGQAPIVGCDSAPPRIEEDFMSTLYISHPAALDHQTPLGHPERPDRIRAIERALEQGALRRARARAGAHGRDGEPRPRPSRGIRRGAPGRLPREGLVRIDEDTVMSPGTYEAALRGAGGAVQAVDEVMTGQVANAFVAMRPPGHHAERTAPWASASSTTRPSRRATPRSARRRAGRDRRLGRASRQRHPGHLLERPQRALLLDPRDAALSRHRRPLRARRARHHRQRALSPGDGSEAFREAFETAILPRIEASARPHRDLGRLRRPLARPARQPQPHGSGLRLGDPEAHGPRRPHCGGRIVSLLEGGYDLEGLSKSVAFHLDALMGVRSGHPGLSGPGQASRGSSPRSSMPKPLRPT
jgi:hypothetical protein